MGNTVIQIDIYQVPPKVKGCPKCEAIVSDEGCGCYSEEVEEQNYDCDCEKSSEDLLPESSEECQEKKYKKYEESSEELPESSEECQEKKYKKSSEEVLPESSEECRDKRYKKSSEELLPESSEEYQNKKYKKCEESSEEVLPESSEECQKKKRDEIRYCQCESSEEIQTESSEECPKTSRRPEPCQEEEDSGEIYDEEHWCKGKLIKIRYSNPQNCSKRFSRSKRELFLDDLQDFSVCSEPLTRIEIQKTIAKIFANSTRKRKGKRRPRPKYLVQNKDQFEENNKFKVDKNLEEKIEEEILSAPNEERNKRHSTKCRTIERLKKKPKYEMDVLADAGCSQYIPEIIFNRNKRHLSTFDGNINFPIKFVDATLERHHHLECHQHHNLECHHHHHRKKSEQKRDSKKMGNFAVDPKFYYKYLSLTAPDLSSSVNKDLPENKKIVFDHLGHKFLEYNGFRTLIKPKIDAYNVDDTLEDKPKFWTCKEDLIHPEDFGKVTTISSDTISTTEIPTTSTTPEIPATPEIRDLQEHEFNLCEYLKNLEETQNVEVQQEAKNVFLKNCEDYIKFLIYNPNNTTASTNVTETVTVTKYLENLLHNSHLKHHFQKLFHTKHKFENNLANITKLLHKPKVLENFKNYLLFKNEFDSVKSQFNLTEYTIFNFYTDALKITDSLTLTT